ncbi:MAG: choice-of-anchor V domain-containing protein [Bacteroidia bacterium]
MKKSLLFGSALAVILLGMSFESVERIEAVQNRTGAPAGHTGSPGDGAICTACHIGGAATAKTGIISTNIPAQGYVPGSTYTITVTLNNPGTTRFGFQLSPQNLAGNMLGTWGPSTAETQVISGKYATHKLVGTNGTDSKVWTLQWTAPVAGTGDVTFYGAFNISNADNNTTGDVIWKTSHTVTEQTSGLEIANLLELNAFVDGNNHLQVRLEETETSRVDIRFVDMNGKQVANWSDASLIDGSWNAALPQLEAGIYLLQVQAGNRVGTKKIAVF